MNRVRGYGILAGSLLLAGGLWLFARSHVYATTTAVPAYVVQLADQVAVSNGDPTPTLAYAIRTTRGPAESVATGGDSVDSPEAPVYLVVMYGHFTTNQAPTPNGEVLTGSVVTFTVNTQTQQMMDGSIGNYSPSLASLESLGPLESFTP